MELGLRVSRRENVLSLSSGSSVPAIYQSHVKRVLYPKPPLAEQRGIAAVLGVLDDKIELNRRMNETLEALAQPDSKAEGRLTSSRLFSSSQR